MRNNLPYLGIYQDLHVVNVDLRETLYEVHKDQRPNSLRHHCWTVYPSDHLEHPVEMDDNSMLADILDLVTIDVNSLHHPVIYELAPELVAVAHAPNSLIETEEISGYPSGFAVLWHPERLQGNLVMRALFRDFVKVASGDL